MFLRRYGTFTGGIDLPDEKNDTISAPIEPWEPIESLRIPLAPFGKIVAEPIVKALDKVTAGQKIAAAVDDSGIDIFSPLSGKVAGLTVASVPVGDSFVESTAIELTHLSKPAGITPVREKFLWLDADTHTICERIAAGALTTHRQPVMLLTDWISKARRTSYTTLIANVMENQPYVTANHRLLAEHGVEVIRGLAILGKAIGADDIVLVVDQRRTGDYLELVGPAQRYGVNLTALVHKYPTGADEILTKVLTRQELPPESDAMDAGVALIDASTCFAVYRWVACEIPPTGRVVTLSGENCERKGNFWIPFGVNCGELFPSKNGQLPIHGGPMTGLRCSSDSVITTSTDAVLALETDHAAAPSPCIRCGWCRDHCPARLNVAELNDAFELGLIEHARKASVMACVECGVCSYVCPARLPLAKRTKQLKRVIKALEKRIPLFTKS